MPVTIYNAADLDRMTPEQRMDLFNELGEQAYGTRRFHKAFALASGWDRKTLYNWNSLRSPIPTGAILLVQEWAGRRTTPEILLVAVQQVARDLENAGRTLRAALKDVGEILKEERNSVVQRSEKLTDPPEPDDDEPAPEDDGLYIDESRL